MMTKLIDRKRIKFYLWMGLAFLLLGILSHVSEDRETFFRRALDDCWRVIFVTVINFILFEFTIPRLSIKNIFTSLLSIIAYFFIYSYGLYLWRSLGILLTIYTPFPSRTQKDEVAVQMGYSVGSVFFFGIIRHIYSYFKLKQATRELQIEKQAAELNYLKSQTNPHFLFNTLNNIYSLARDKSDLAPESILRLSKILRYMLYETSGPYIAIEKELKIIVDYIALEKLRYDESLRVNFNHDVEDLNQALPPLLLVPLVENAFKHGVSETSNQPFVDIHLSVNKRQLSFIVVNSTGDFSGDSKPRENIGLSNLRRQLQLLFTDYNLSVQQDEFEFKVILKINLSSHT